MRAARVADRPAFDETLAQRDPAFGDRARLLYDNLSSLPLQDLAMTLQPEERPLRPARRSVLGEDSWRQQATVTWRLVGEVAPAEHTVWLTFVPEGARVLLAGTVDQPDDEVVPQPVWWTGPVTSVREGPVTVLVGSGQPGPRWAARVTAAAEQVRPRVTAGAAARWNGAVVVEVPASRRDFEAVLGAAPGSYTGIAAVTLAEGPGPAAAVRIVVNPDVASTLAPLGVSVVLTHEVVHVATRSVDSPAPTWAVEGLADYIALDVHPEAAEGAAAPLVRQVRQQGAPTELPTDERFRAGESDLSVAYAEAWFACRYLAAGYSPAALQRLYTALDEGRPLDRAAQDELGVSAANLTAGWRQYLAQQAGR